MSEVKLCIHTKMNGKQCRGIALVGKSYCRFHNRYYERHCITNQDYELPIFEDSRSIMMGIHELVHSRIKGKVDNRDVTAYMYAYQVAASLMNRPDAMAPDVAEDFEREARNKAVARISGRGKSSGAAEQPEGDPPTLFDTLLDDYDEYRREECNPYRAEHGLPLLEPLPKDDRDAAFEAFVDDFDLGEDFRMQFKGWYHRFPGDKWVVRRPSVETVASEGEPEPSEVATANSDQDE
jgi:hypothetical protein